MFKGDNESVKTNLYKLKCMEQEKIPKMIHHQTLFESKIKTIDILSTEIILQNEILNDTKRKLLINKEQLDSIIAETNELIQKQIDYDKHVQVKHNTCNKIEEKSSIILIEIQTQNNIIEDLRQKLHLANSRKQELNVQVQHLKNKTAPKTVQLEKDKQFISQTIRNIQEIDKRQEKNQLIIKTLIEELRAMEQEMQELQENILEHEKRYDGLCKKRQEVNKGLNQNDEVIMSIYQKLIDPKNVMQRRKELESRMQYKYEPQSFEILKR
ncbi:unnamed protein product [Rotaria sp. Silwood2]|nr:unnamed protein product [Rotaria sp. Silwood2]